METFWQDVRYGARMLRKRPGFAAVAVLTLALGIGANTAIFTLLNGVFLRPLPFEDLPGLVQVFTTDAKNATAGFRLHPVSYRNYEDFRDQTDVFTGLACVASAGVTIRGQGDPAQINGQLVTANYFDVLGVKAALGRTFLPVEDQTPGGNPVTVISHSVWQKYLGGDPNVIGRTVILNSGTYTVIGVAPPSFRGTAVLAQPEFVWIPLSMWQQALSGFFRDFLMERRALLTEVIGRLKPGVTLEEAEVRVKAVASRLEKEYPADNEGRNARLVHLADATLGAFPGQGANQRGQFVLAGTLLMTVVGLILLIACANLASLLLTRAAVREKEMALRAALGARRGRLIRQLLTESVLLSLLGGVVGLVIAYWGRDLLWAFRPPFLGDDAVTLPLDGSVLLFTLSVSVVIGLLFGLAPALRVSRAELTDTLKAGGRGGTLAWSRSRLRSLLVVSEVALALVALVGAGLFLRSLQQAQKIRLGFESEKLFTFFFNLGARQYTPERGQQFFDQAVARARAVPGVEAAAVSSNYLFGGGAFRSVFPEGQTPEPGRRGILVLVNQISSGYFDVMRIPLLRGRVFNEFDRENSARVAVINEAMAQRFWPGEDPLGKRFLFFRDTALMEVVGVVGNTVVLQIGEDPQPVAYVPMRQSYAPLVSVVVRTSGRSESVQEPVRGQVQDLDRDLALDGVATVGELLNRSLWAPRTGASLLSLFGLLAMGLAAVGIYGVMAQSVSQRTQEIGIRMAMGARPRDILSLVVSQGMLLAGVGLAVGLGLALLGGRFVSSLLFGIRPTDPVTLTGIPLLLALVALLACYLPARRAARVDPMVALRYE